MKKALYNVAKGTVKWVVAVVLSIVGYIGTGLIAIIVFIKALHIDSVGLLFFVLFLGLVSGACFYLLIKAIINRILVGKFTPFNVIIDDRGRTK